MEHLIKNPILIQGLYQKVTMQKKESEIKWTKHLCFQY